MLVAPIDNCVSIKYVQGIFFVTGGPATSLLFLFRVKAVYNHSRLVTGLSSLLVLGLTGSEYGLFFGISSCANYVADRIPYTRRCIAGVSNTTYVTIPIVMTAVFDTLVFLAISYRMVSVALSDNTWGARAKSFFRGDGLHRLSKALLQSGQAYYLSVLY